MLALEIARLGHTVVGCSRSQEKVQALMAELTRNGSASSSSSSKHLLKHLDVSSDRSVKEFAELVVEEGKIPDIIVNNAGTINKNNKIWAVPAEEFDMVIDTNIKGIANVLRHFLPLLIAKKRGVVVNISSGWGRSAAAEVAPYCASKWAIEGLSKSVAKELPPGLAIVALNPGVVNTDMLVSCFGSNSALYQSPEAWAPKAAMMILNLTSEDNGASLTI